METKRLEKLSDEEILSIKSFMLNNFKSTTSANRGKSPNHFGYTIENIKAMEIKFDYIYGTDKFTIFCQKDDEQNGKGFSSAEIDDAMYDVFISLYFQARDERKNRRTNLFSLSVNNKAQIEEQVYIDPDLINDREC